MKGIKHECQLIERWDMMIMEEVLGSVGRCDSCQEV